MSGLVGPDGRPMGAIGGVPTVGQPIPIPPVGLKDENGRTILVPQVAVASMPDQLIEHLATVVAKKLIEVLNLVPVTDEAGGGGSSGE